MPNHLVTISGSYRSGGITEQSVALLTQEATRRGWTTENIRLIDRQINYCRNCRGCTQAAGDARGTCVIQDDVAAIWEAIDRSQALVIAAPTNFFDATAVTRTFLERLVPVGYWPWGKAAPASRAKSILRPAVLLTSTAMPGIMARYFTRTMKSLKDMARCLRARPVDRVYLGLAAIGEAQRLSPRAQKRLRRAAARLLG